ncbi:hypothetical protein CYY_008272 [Polysphondylium violaceum]|uniref:LisH domain-containing protein n=1 Tax=Polysphondylium violaceum TaxID=133409 RepID=A0A8J4PNV2_9MYCE|nr:hypothetical protein CYY_008272 [Polysphondylium violaceum]
MNNKEEIAKFLLNKGYYLTALEFYQELLEDDGTELSSLKDHFSQIIAQSDPVKSINRAKSPTTSTTNDTESLRVKDEKISLLEYELRQCQDDLKQLRSQYNTITKNTPPSSNTSSSNTSNSNTNSSSKGSSSNDPHLSISKEEQDNLLSLAKDKIKTHELKILNFLVKKYLKTNNYTLTAVSFSEETEEHANKWSDMGMGASEPPSILTMYRYFFENGDSGIQGALSKSMSEVTKLKKDLTDTENNLRETKIQMRAIKQERDDLVALNTTYEKKLEEVSKKGLLSSSGFIPSPKLKSQDQSTTTTTTTSKSPSKNEIDDSNLSVMRKTYRSLVEKRRQTVAFRIVYNMDDESEISVRIAEEVDKIRTLDADNQSVVKIVADSLPHIVPGVLINKREELIPLILVSISNHPDETVRFSLTKLLFNLIKKPNEVQRHVIMRGCTALASFIGPQRTESEILSQCWEQLSEKHPERRVLVADSCGCLAQYANPELRLSLILSILQQLGEDKSSLVRQSVAKNFSLLINFFESSDKYNQIEESFKKLLYDSDTSVSLSARSHFLPSLANWTDLLESLHSKLINFILNEMLLILNKYFIQKEEFKIPEVDVVKIDQLLLCLIDVVPRIYQSVISSSPFVTDKDAKFVEGEYNKAEALFQFQLLNSNPKKSDDPNNNNNNNSKSNNNNNDHEEATSSGGDSANNNSNSNSNNNMGAKVTNTSLRINILGNQEISKLGSQFDQFLLSTLSNDVAGWESLEWVANEFITKFIKIISCIPLSNSLLVSGFSKALNTFCKTFGTVFTKRVVKNAFHKEFQKDPRADNTKKHRLISVFTTGALQTLDSSEIITFLKELIVQISMEERGWVHENIPALVKCMEMLCSNVYDKKKEVNDTLCELSANPSNQVRSCILNLLKVIIPFFKPEQISSSIIPSLITLSTDPDRTVRFVCLGTFAVAVSNLIDPSAIERVAISIDKILEDKNHQLEIEFVKSMVKIIPTVNPRFRDSFILPRLVELSRKNNHNPSNEHRREMSQNLFDATRAYLSISNAPRDLIQEQILPITKMLLNDAQLHDTSFKSMVQSLISDVENSFKEDFKNSIQKRGGSSGANTSSANTSSTFGNNINFPKWGWKQGGNMK